MTYIFRIIIILICAIGPASGIYAQSNYELSDLRDEMLKAFNNGEYDEAIVTGIKIIEIDPHNDEAYAICGLSYGCINIYPLAIEYMSRAVELSPSVGTYVNLATIHSELGHDSISISMYEKIIDMDPTFFYAYNNRGGTYLQLHRYDEAKKDLEMALTLKPSSVHAHMNMGNLYRLQEKYDDALVYYKKTLELNPEYEDALYNIGIIKDKTGQADSANYFFNRAIDLYSRKIEKNHYDYNSILYRGRAYLKINEPQLAKADFENILSIYNDLVNQTTDSWAIIYKRGFIYFELEKYEDAKADFEKVLSLNPAHKDSAKKLSEIKEKETK